MLLMSFVKPSHKLLSQTMNIDIIEYKNARKYIVNVLQGFDQGLLLNNPLATNSFTSSSIFFSYFFIKKL